MGPRGFWIAFAIVLFCIITRPRLGTVWYAKMPDQPLPSGVVTASPGASFVAGTPPPGTFPSIRNCMAVIQGYREEQGGHELAYCVSKYAILWGW